MALPEGATTDDKQPLPQQVEPAIAALDKALPSTSVACHPITAMLRKVDFGMEPALGTALLSASLMLAALLVACAAAFTSYRALNTFQVWLALGLRISDGPCSHAVLRMLRCRMWPPPRVRAC
jgi:hypothetical protein